MKNLVSRIEFGYSIISGNCNHAADTGSPSGGTYSDLPGAKNKHADGLAHCTE